MNDTPLSTQGASHCPKCEAPLPDSPRLAILEITCSQCGAELVQLAGMDFGCLAMPIPIEDPSSLIASEGLRELPWHKAAIRLFEQGRNEMQNVTTIDALIEMYNRRRAEPRHITIAAGMLRGLTGFALKWYGDCVIATVFVQGRYRFFEVDRSIVETANGDSLTGGTAE